jgi:hypothetical protein
MDNKPTLTIGEDGDKIWRLPNDNLHRVGGPAIEYTDGHKSWWLTGENYKFDAWLEANIYISEEEKVMMKLIYG